VTFTKNWGLGLPELPGGCAREQFLDGHITTVLTALPFSIYHLILLLQSPFCILLLQSPFSSHFAVLPWPSQWDLLKFFCWPDALPEMQPMTLQQ